MYEIGAREYKAKNVFAGDFPTLAETGTAAAAIEELTMVTKDADGKIIAVAADTLAGVIGISAVSAAQDEEAVYYMTGEFFQEAIKLPENVTLEAAKDALRKVSIFLR